MPKCQCGCGTEVGFWDENDAPAGRAKGAPKKWVQWHWLRVQPPHRKRKPLSEADYAIEDRGHATSCWIWQHGTNSKGYGTLNRRGHSPIAHRAFYESAHGSLDGMPLHHLCGVKQCVNPEHLEPIEASPHSSLHQNRLPDEVVRRIRKDNRPQRTIAAEVGLSKTTIGFIKRGITYKDVN